MRFEFIEKNRSSFPVRKMCQVLNVSQKSSLARPGLGDRHHLFGRSGGGKWHYLTVFIDLISRIVVGWVLSNSLEDQ